MAVSLQPVTSSPLSTEAKTAADNTSIPSLKTASEWEEPLYMNRCHHFKQPIIVLQNKLRLNIFVFTYILIRTFTCVYNIL